jgi:CheY-like chemotaxis protein
VNYGIVQRHGGELLIDSAAARGTTVTVRLPAMQNAFPSPTRTAMAVGERRILLVDDEIEVLEALGELLTGEGHVVWLANDGAEALSLLQHHPMPDLVLTDLGMPGMTGYELVRSIKARWPELPVGLITGWGEEPAVPDAIGAKGDFILSKPVNLNHLLDVVARVAPRPARERA